MSPISRCRGCPTSASSVKSAASASTIVLNNNGQTSGQITAQAAFANAVSLLNSQSGDRYLFSGRATDQRRRPCRPTSCSTASARRPD